MHEITNKLLVGNIYDAEKPPASVGALLLVAGEYSTRPPAGLVYEQIPLTEYGEAEIISLDRAVAWIEQQTPDNQVMVCCRAGMGRSVSVVIAYLCCVDDMAYPDALKLAITRRPGAVPLPNLRSAVEQVQKLREDRKRTGSTGKF